ncbi:DUF3971 domain-containing protein [Zavarzinia compransoris]|uniref:DUF3971 domain-containing protein n=1 Tax=Zavarzinia marina TaxID=2911065 RepID=UPI001F44610E|nr:DUF3971 domain-containing protein [Zavarzinia marina]MCF4164516.1 DUF3971 domain-containing protein [Zavarzinia marina]
MVRRASRVAAHVFGAFLTAFLIAAVGIALRLAMGPISLGFLSPMVEDGFAGNPDGLTLSVGDTVLAWNGIDNDIALQVVGLELRDRNDALVARLPKADINLSARALLEGTLAPTGVAVPDAELRIHRTPDGAVRMGFGGGMAATPLPIDEPAADVAPLRPVMDLLRRGPGNAPALRWLERLSLERARVVVEDEVTARRWIAGDANAEVRRDADGAVEIAVRADLASAGETVAIRALGRMAAGDGGGLSLDVEFAGLVPALFDAGGATLGPAAGIVMPLSGKLEATVGGDGEIATVGFMLDAGEGGLDLPQLFPEGLTLDSIRLAGRYDGPAALVTLDALEVTRGDFRLEAAGSASLGPEGLGLDMEVRLPNAPIDDLGTVWPVAMSVNGRRWVMQNVRGGALTGGVFTVKLPPGGLDAEETPADLLSGDFRVKGAATTYIDGLPPVADMSVKGHVTADDLTMAIDGGRVDMGEDGVVTLTAGAAKVTEFNAPDQYADISFTATGPVRAAMALMNRKPLGYADKIGMTPAALSGVHETTARFVLPLVADLDLDNLKFDTTSRIDGLGIAGVVGPLDLTAGTVAIKVDQTHAEGTGRAQLAGAPLDLDWRESFRPGADGITTRLSATGTFDEDLRHKLGFDAGTRLTGPVMGRVTLEGRGQKIAAIEGMIDLTRAAIALPEAGYAKPAGVPGDVSFRVAPGKDMIRVENLRAKAPDLDLVGAATLSSAGIPLNLVVSRVRFGRNEFSLNMARTAVGQRYQLSMRGKTLDLSPYLALDAPERLPESERPDPSAPDRMPDFDFELALDRVILDEGTSITALEATGDHGAGLWRSITARGALGPTRAPLHFRLIPGQGRRTLDVAAGDFGAIARALGLYSDFLGGDLRFTGAIDDTRPNRPLTGSLEVKNFEIVRAPVLAKILTLGSLTGIAETIGGEGISFEALRADVRMDSDVLRIDKARAYGNSIGMTLAGTYDTWGRSVSVGGTIVPSYGINRFLGSIPLVGDILTGGDGGGLFAFNYNVVGAVEDPSVTVNPLSALAPGILRDIVSAIDGTDSAADADAPPVIDVPQK